jgi:hypothetical protein
MLGGMTADEMMGRMSNSEFVRWQAYLMMRNGEYIQTPADMKATLRAFWPKKKK